jgi:hypothetical protein
MQKHCDYVDLCACNRMLYEQVMTALYPTLLRSLLSLR